MSSASPPSTYAAWQELLDRFRAGDDGVIASLESGRIEWSPGVAERWTSRMHEVLADRLRALSAQLQKDLDRARERHAVEAALVRAGRSMEPLARFCRLSCTPPEVRSHLLGELERWARQTRSSLETQVARDHRGDQGVLLRSVRAAAARLEVPPETTAPSIVPSQPGTEAAPSDRRRRILS